MERSILTAMLKLLFVWGIILYITVDGKSFNSEEDRIVEENGLLADESHKITSNDQMTINNDLEGSKPVFMSNFEDVTVEEDNFQELFCQATGERPITYEWYNPYEDEITEGTNKTIFVTKSMNGSVLTFQGVDKNDEGVYVCKASNKHGLSSKLYQLTVLPKTNRCEDFCLNGGNCSLYSGNPICACPSPFGGVRCEIDICEGYCMNGGICTVESNYTRCDCQHEFKGEKCEIDSCKDFCLNGGNCSHSYNGYPTCSCTPLFEGRNCEKEKCETFCRNGGTCVTDSGYPRCFCPPTFMGENCDVCSCGEHGQCLADSGKKLCICHNGYEENNGICIVKQTKVSGFERIVFIFAVIFSVLVALLTLSSCLQWRRINIVSKSKI